MSPENPSEHGFNEEEEKEEEEGEQSVGEANVIKSTPRGSFPPDLLTMTEDEIKQKYRGRRINQYLSFFRFVTRVNALAKEGVKPTGDLKKWVSSTKAFGKADLSNSFLAPFLRALTPEAKALYIKVGAFSQASHFKQRLLSPELVEQLTIAAGHTSPGETEKLTEGLLSIEQFEKIDNRFAESEALGWYKRLLPEYPNQAVFLNNQSNKPFLKPDFARAIFNKLTINKRHPGDWEGEGQILAEFANQSARAEQIFYQLCGSHPLWVWHYIDTRRDPDEVIVSYSPELKKELKKLLDEEQK